MVDAPRPSPDAGRPRPARSPITDRLPAGVMPRQLQQWVLIGVAVVMVGIMALSGPPTKPRPTAAPSPAAAAVDPNQQRIEEYQRRIQEQAQRLAAEQAQLQLTKDGRRAATRDAAASPEPSRRLAECGSTDDQPAPSARRVTGPRGSHAVADNVAFSRPAAPARPQSPSPRRSRRPSPGVRRRALPALADCTAASPAGAPPAVRHPRAMPAAAAPVAAPLPQHAARSHAGRRMNRATRCSKAP